MLSLKASFAIGKKIAKEKIALLLCEQQWQQ
jgi:hypothetical protein